MGRRINEGGIVAEMPIPLLLAKAIAEEYMLLSTDAELKQLLWKAVKIYAETNDDFINLGRLVTRIRRQKYEKTKNEKPC